MKIQVKEKLLVPIIKEESFTVTCFEELNKYHIYNNRNYKGGDITDMINLLMGKLKTLGHDGEMEIKIKRVIEYKQTEITEEEFINKLKWIASSITIKGGCITAMGMFSDAYNDRLDEECMG